MPDEIPPTENTASEYLTRKKELNGNHFFQCFQKIHLMCVLYSVRIASLRTNRNICFTRIHHA